LVVYIFIIWSAVLWLEIIGPVMVRADDAPAAADPVAA